MSDLIDREELIYSIEFLPFYHEFWKTEGYEGLWKSEDVINRIKNMPSVQRWIPVSEGLPKKTGCYAVSLGVGVVTYDFWTGVDWGTFVNVEAWMKMPKPYKGGDDE